MSPELSMPATEVLERQLSSVLGSVVVCGRRANPMASRHPSEIVTCDRAGTKVRVLCKHAMPRALDVHGLATGVEYEAAVYRAVLDRCSLSHPVFHGMAIDSETGAQALVVGYLDECERVQKSADSQALACAASWIGSFQGAHDGRKRPGALNTYDVPYFAGWVRRASDFAGISGGGSGVCTWFEEQAVPALASAGPTILHGEYYPDNILYRDGVVFPVDWECAAIGAGEIDLAALTEGWWPADAVAACVEAYCSSRWPSGAPATFAKRLSAARAYLHLRWLGGRPERAGTDEAARRWAELERIAGAWDDPTAWMDGAWLRSG